MKLIKLILPDELHSSIKLYCKFQKISMNNFIPELINKGWEVINGNTLSVTYNDDGTPKIS